MHEIFLTADSDKSSVNSIVEKYRAANNGPKLNIAVRGPRKEKPDSEVDVAAFQKMRPSLILANSNAGPAGVMEQLKSSGVPLILLSNAHTPDAAAERIRIIGREIDRATEADTLVAEIWAQLFEAAAVMACQAACPRVMFIYTRGGGIRNVAGRGTGAEAMIKLAGGVNAVCENDGYKPLTAEGALLAAPDYILVSSRGLELFGGVAELLTQPGLRRPWRAAKTGSRDGRSVFVGIRTTARPCG